MNIVIKPIGDLKNYDNNARMHSDEQIEEIANSIKVFGFNDPIEIDSDNMIISGHARLAAALKLGLKEVPTIEHKHLDANNKKAYILAANRIAMSSTWDNLLLKDELLGLKDDDFDLSLIGFTDDELSDLLNIEIINDGLVGDEDSCGEAKPDPITKLGDIWLLGEHRLMCGDSTSVDDIDKLMNSVKADILITDPPYNVSYEGKTKDALTIENDEMNNEDFRQFLRDAFTCADIHLKQGGVFYIWHADTEGYNFRGACFDVGWKIRQCLIWVKNSFVMGRQDYHWKHEPCLYGWKDGKSHYWGADRKQTTLLEFDRPIKNDIHPTMKPVELIQYQILNNTKPGYIVLDLFGGSGTTLIASHKTNRKCYMSELDPRYCDVIIRRWQQYTGKKALLESTGEEFQE